jgi:hypothetical protein
LEQKNLVLVEYLDNLGSCTIKILKSFELCSIVIENNENFTIDIVEVNYFKINIDKKQKSIDFFANLDSRMLTSV